MCFTTTTLNTYCLTVITTNLDNLIVVFVISSHMGMLNAIICCFWIFFYLIFNFIFVVQHARDWFAFKLMYLSISQAVSGSKHKQKTIVITKFKKYLNVLIFVITAAYTHTHIWACICISKLARV